MRPLWQGKIPIENVKWVYSDDRPKFPESVHKHSTEYWVKMKKRHPEIYDGDILWLNEFKTNNDTIEFIISSIKFSELLSLSKLKITNYRGQLGFKVLITSPQGKILIGQRNKRTQYKPGWFQVPGGVLEKFDLEGSFLDACMREIQEEVLIPIKSTGIYIEAILPDANETGVQVVIRAQLDTQIAYVPANEEWEDNILKWYSRSEIENKLPRDKLLEGIVHFLSM